MNLFPFNKNTIALVIVATIGIGFFIAGLFDVLDYFIIKVLLFLCYIALIVIAFNYGVKNEKKNRPEDKLQNDSH